MISTLTLVLVFIAAVFISVFISLWAVSSYVDEEIKKDENFLEDFAFGDDVSILRNKFEKFSEATNENTKKTNNNFSSHMERIRHLEKFLGIEFKTTTETKTGYVKAPKKKNA